MALPFYYHIGNSGGLSFVRAAVRAKGVAAAALDEVLEINNEMDLELARADKLAPEHIARLQFAAGHAVYLAEPWIADRYELTILRWPTAVFCANIVYVHENPDSLPSSHPFIDLFAIADHHDRMRAYLDHLDQGGVNVLWPTAFWIARRHQHDGLKSLPREEWTPAACMAALDACDAALRDRYQLVGITELMDEALFLYLSDFPGRQINPWVRTRVSKAKVDVFNLPGDIAARIARCFEADNILYDRARQRMLARFADFWRDRPDLHEYYLAYKTAMVLTDPLLMARFAEGDPLYFPPELPLDELRHAILSQIDRAPDIRARMLRAYG
ncbi:MAG: hypothetical protein IT562_13170 [Alphaproteobacteria bacterium]|nr:hypothetical protein [Alphaproteobacteria bacterium]